MEAISAVLKSRKRGAMTAGTISRRVRLLLLYEYRSTPVLAIIGFLYGFNTLLAGGN